MKNALFAFLLVVLVYFGYQFFSKPAGVSPITVEEREKRINEHIKTLRAFLNKKSDYNSGIVFLIDMKIMSGNNRFFIYDLNKNMLLDQGLVAHGCGSETGIGNELKFSNVNNSKATSLGRYGIGGSYVGQFGKSYKLYGLDKSNSNAFSRYIVLHKYSKMPYEEQVTPVCNSYGCPMVNKTFFKRIEKIVDSSDKKILLDIYY